MILCLKDIYKIIIGSKYIITCFIRMLLLCNKYKRICHFTPLHI